MDPTALSYLLGFIPTAYVGWVLSAMALCALADALFPQPVPGSPWVRIRRVISFIGANFGAARNRVRPGTVNAIIAAARGGDAVSVIARPALEQAATKILIEEK